AGVNPSLLVGERLSVAVPITRWDVGATHENLTVLAQLHFLTGDGFSDRALPLAKRMRKTRERRRLSHAVTLNDRVPTPSPERFRFTLKRGAARNKRPQSPAKLTMNFSERPPVAQEVPVLGGDELVVGNLRVSLDLLAQCFQNTRHSDHDVDAIFFDCRHDFRRFVRLAEINFSREELRNKDSHQLPEDVTQGQQAQKAQWMYETFPTRVSLEFLFNWREVGEEISVRET